MKENDSLRAPAATTGLATYLVNNDSTNTGELHKQVCWNGTSEQLISQNGGSGAPNQYASLSGAMAASAEMPMIFAFQHANSSTTAGNGTGNGTNANSTSGT